MSLLAYLISQFWPAILGGAAILGGWFWHSVRVAKAEERGEERANARTVEANRRRREEMDAVPRPSADETIRRLRRGGM